MKCWIMKFHTFVTFNPTTPLLLLLIPPKLFLLWVNLTLVSSHSQLFCLFSFCRLLFYSSAVHFSWWKSVSSFRFLFSFAHSTELRFPSSQLRTFLQHSTENFIFFFLFSPIDLKTWKRQLLKPMNNKFCKQRHAKLVVGRCLKFVESEKLCLPLKREKMNFYTRKQDAKL